MAARNFETVSAHGERAELYEKLKKELHEEAAELVKEGEEVVMMFLPPGFNLNNVTINTPADVFPLVDFLCYTQTKSNEEWRDFMTGVLGELDSAEQGGRAAKNALTEKFHATLTPEELNVMSFVLSSLYGVLEKKDALLEDAEEGDDSDEEEEGEAEVVVPLAGSDSIAPAA